MVGMTYLASNLVFEGDCYSYLYGTANIGVLSFETSTSVSVFVNISDRLLDLVVGDK